MNGLRDGKPAKLVRAQALGESVVHTFPVWCTPKLVPASIQAESLPYLGKYRSEML